MVTWDRVSREQLALEGLEAGRGERSRLPERCRGAAGWLLGVTVLLLVVGTLATGTGPHAGDSSDVHWMPFNWTVVTVLHGSLAVAALALTGYLLRALPKDGRGRARQKELSFVAVVLAQSALGVVQSLSGLPAPAVGLHLLGSALVWTGAVQVFLATRFEAQQSAAELPGPKRGFGRGCGFTAPPEARHGPACNCAPRPGTHWTPGTGTPPGSSRRPNSAASWVCTRPE
ncbi:hypothetical protein GCM10017688_41270 [Streptomyces ramulosus]